MTDQKTETEINQELEEALISLRTTRTLETSPEFTTLFRNIRRALKTQSLNDMKSIQREVKKMGISPSLGIEGGVDDLVKGLTILFGK